MTRIPAIALLALTACASVIACWPAAYPPYAEGGPLLAYETASVGATKFGCDVCLECCPLIEREDPEVASFRAVNVFDYCAIYWDRDRLQALDFSTQVATFAHELGHSFDWRRDHALAKSRESELSADRWAGCILASAEVDPLPAFAYWGSLSDDGDYHPDGALREAAMRAGFAECASARPDAPRSR